VRLHLPSREEERQIRESLRSKGWSDLNVSVQLMMATAAALGPKRNIEPLARLRRTVEEVQDIDKAAIEASNAAA